MPGPVIGSGPGPGSSTPQGTSRTRVGSTPATATATFGLPTPVNLPGSIVINDGNGTAQHMIGTQFQIVSGAQVLHVPYKGSAPLTTDLLGGQVDMSFDTVTPVLPFIKEGKLKPLAVTTAKRSSALPNVPTLQEAGVPGVAIGTWFGLLAPAATPKPVVQKLNTEIVKIINSAEFKKQMLDIGAEPIGNKPEEMAKQIKEETEKFASLVKAGKVTLD